MIDITRAEIIHFGDGQQVTVYDDFEDANLKYIVPSPRFAYQEVDNELRPVFSLLEYTVEGGARRGTLAFSVELYISEAARLAVVERFPDARFGQLSWLEADVFLEFRVREDEEIRVFAASPSLAGSNQATYLLSLESAADLDFIIANFGPGAPDISQLKLSYDVTTATKLRAVTATVEFNAERALEYERTVDVEKNMWGAVTSRKETIRQNLKASESGKTLIDYNIPNPSEPLQQRVENWAFTTLEGLVQRAVDEAAERLGPGNADQMSATFLASFSRSFEENQVIEWVIAPETLLPAAEIRDRWDQHHQQVDFRNLVTSFTLLGALADAGIDRVDLTVTYGDIIESFRFEEGTEDSVIFRADGRRDGEGHFDPNFSYDYTVFFNDGRTFQLEKPVSTANTQNTLNLADLGVVRVSIDGRNLNWDELDQVTVGFFFQPPAALPPINETKFLKRGEPIVAFDSQHMMRISNFAFNYQLAFRLKDGTLYRQSPIRLAGASANRPVRLEDPLQETVYTVAVNNVEGGPQVTRALLTGTYEDPINGFHFQRPMNFSTDGQEYVQHDVSLRTVANPNASFLRINGRLLMAGAPVQPLNDIYISGQDTFLLLNSDQRPFSIKFDPFQVDWQGGVSRVQVDVFNAVERGGGKFERGLFSRSITFAAVQDVDGAAALEIPTPPQFFSFDFDLEAQPIYVYQVTYFHVDGPPTFTDETTADRGTVVLPKDGHSQAPVQHLVREATDIDTIRRVAA